MHPGERLECSLYCRVATSSPICPSTLRRGERFPVACSKELRRHVSHRGCSGDVCVPWRSRGWRELGPSFVPRCRAAVRSTRSEESCSSRLHAGVDLVIGEVSVTRALQERSHSLGQELTEIGHRRRGRVSGESEVQKTVDGDVDAPAFPVEKNLNCTLCGATKCERITGARRLQANAEEPAERVDLSAETPARRPLPGEFALDGGGR